ncbi:MAG: hydantoinase/oxoprolinase family protein, partial [Gaiellaceae bacterium]
RAAHLLLSGIAGGAIGGAHFARSAGADQAIVLDMGGTSCDVCLIVDGEPLYSSDYEIEFGLPVSVPSVSTRTIGAGGGSIGWVDPGGFLQVGLQSAGAVPGPACYGQGGEEATITDANVALGRLDPSFFLGGRIQLDTELSKQAVGALAAKLEMSDVETASAMLRITNENMANAIRIVTVEEGIDPRQLALVALGGAGPTHAAEIADSLAMRRVLVPPSPGLGSAFGALAATVRVDAVRSVYLTDAGATAGELDAMFSELEEQAQTEFAHQGSDTNPEVRRSIAMRYQGQNYEQEVAVPAGSIDEDALAAIYVDYGRFYEEFYGYRLDGIPIELVQLSVIVSGAPPELAGELLAASGDSSEAGTRDVFFPEHGFVETSIRRREGLSPTEQLSGPIVVESMDSTIVVPPAWQLERLPSGILNLTKP